MANSSICLDYEGKKLFKGLLSSIKAKKYEPPSKLSLKTAKKVYSCFKRTIKRYKINEEYECSLFFYQHEKIITVNFCFQQDGLVTFEVKDNYFRISITRFFANPSDIFIYSDKLFSYESIVDETVKKLKSLLYKKEKENGRWLLYTKEKENDLWIKAE